MTGISSTDRDTALVRASALADNYLQRRYALPLSSWSDTVRQCVCHIALYWLVSPRGFDPAAVGSTPRKLYEDALKTLENIVAYGDAGITDSTPTVEEGGTYVVTNRKRGWR